MWHTALHHWWDWQTTGSFLLEKREPLWISTSFWLITPPTGVTASASSASCSAAPLLHPADSIAPITYRPLFYQSYHCHATSFNTESASFIPVATTRRHQHQIPLLRIRLEITTCLTNDRSSMSPVINILFYFILFYFFIFLLCHSLLPLLPLQTLTKTARGQFNLKMPTDWGSLFNPRRSFGAGFIPCCS